MFPSFQTHSFSEHNSLFRVIEIFDCFEPFHFPIPEMKLQVLSVGFIMKKKKKNLESVFMTLLIY